MIRGIIDIYKKSVAATIARSFLEEVAKEGFGSLPPASTSASLIEVVWENDAPVFNGSCGQRPFKLTVAAASFAQGIKNSRYSMPEKFELAICLGKILKVIDEVGHRFPLNGIDRELLSGASRAQAEFSDEVSNTDFGIELKKLITDAQGEPQ